MHKGQDGVGGDTEAREKNGREKQMFIARPSLPVEHEYFAVRLPAVLYAKRGFTIERAIPSAAYGVTIVREIIACALYFCELCSFFVFCPMNFGNRNVRCVRITSLTLIFYFTKHVSICIVVLTFPFYAYRNICTLRTLCVRYVDVTFCGKLYSISR